MGAHVLGLGNQARSALGRDKLRAPQLAAALVVRHGLQAARLPHAAHARDHVAAHVAARDLAAVKQQRHGRRAGVDLDVGHATLAALPGPRVGGVRHLPGARRVLVAGVVDRANSHVGALLAAQRDACVERLAQRLAGEVHTAGTSRQPAELQLARGVVLVLPRAHARLAQVVHASPHKVAHQARVILGKAGEAPGVRAKRLGAQDQAVRIGAQVVLIAVDAVVVAGHVHGRVGVARDPVAEGQRGAALHEARAQDARQVVEELAAHGAAATGSLVGGKGLCGGGLLSGLLVGVLAKAHRAQKVEEDVDAAAHGPCGVKVVEKIGHLAGKLDAALLSRLAHLVACGVGHHARVVLVLGHHVGQVLAPPLVEVVHVVVLRLVDVPVVDVLVHDQHAQAVAGVEKGARAGVMRAPDGVVALRQHKLDLALLGVGPGTGAQDAVVVVDAGPLQDHALAVEEKTVVAPLQAADAKGGQGLVAAAVLGLEGHAAEVERGVGGAPQLGLGKVKLHVGRGRRGRGRLAGSQGLLAVQGRDLNKGLARGRDLDVDAHAGGRDRKRAQAHAVAGHVRRRARPQGDGAIDARARVPAAVGLVGVSRHHADLALAAGGHEIGQVHVEDGVAVGAFGHLGAVDPDLGQVIDALELEDQGLARHVGRRGEAAHVLVVAAHEPTAVVGAGGALVTHLADHGVVRELDRLPGLGLGGLGSRGALPYQVPIRPSVVERNRAHALRLLGRLAKPAARRVRAAAQLLHGAVGQH